jgi:hypothetical protein
MMESGNNGKLGSIVEEVALIFQLSSHYRKDFRSVPK